MSNWFWEKLKYFAEWISAIVFFVLVIFLSNIEIKDVDLWLHLASGKYILQHLIIPRLDFLSCTIPGKIWINHEWLFQVIVSIIYNNSGIDGIIFMQVVIVFFTFLILFSLGYNGKNIILQSFLLLLVLLVYQSRLTHRPDLFSLLFMVIYIYVLSSRLGSRSVFIILFILQVLWSNIHGFFILGPMLVALSLLAELIKRKIKLPFEWNNVGVLDDNEYFNLKISLFIVVLACFVNPYFIQGAIYPIKVLFSLHGDSKLFFGKIVELQRPITLQNIFSMGIYLQFKLLIIFSAFSFFLNRKKLDVGLFILWLCFLIFALSAKRNVMFFSIIAYLVIIANIPNNNILFDFFHIKKYPKLRSAIVLILCAVLIYWIIQFFGEMSLHGYYDFDHFRRKQEMGGVSLRNYPYKAADFLVDNNIKGNFFNDFNSGSYLLGRTYPNIKVFIDGRTEVYGSELFKLQNKILKGDINLFNNAVKKYKLTGVFLGSVYVPIPKDMMRHLYKDSNWELVYFDYDAAIFLENIKQNKKTIDKYSIDLNKYQTKKMDLLKVGVKNIAPYRYINRANALLNMGFALKAEAEAKEALRIAPYYGEPYKTLARIYKEENKFEKEYEYLRPARIFYPRDNRLNYEIALAWYNMGKLILARDRCLKMLVINKKDVLVLELLSMIYAKQKDFNSSVYYLKRLLTISPDSIDAIIKVGDIFYEANNLDAAKNIYLMALGKKSQQDIIKNKISVCNKKTSIIKVNN